MSALKFLSRLEKEAEEYSIDLNGHKGYQLYINSDKTCDEIVSQAFIAGANSMYIVNKFYKERIIAQIEILNTLLNKLGVEYTSVHFLINNSIRELNNMLRNL